MKILGWPSSAVEFWAASKLQDPGSRPVDCCPQIFISNNILCYMYYYVWMFVLCHWIIQSKQNFFRNWIKTNFEIVGLLGNIFLLNLPDFGAIWQFFTDFSSFFTIRRKFLRWAHDFELERGVSDKIVTLTAKIYGEWWKRGEIREKTVKWHRNRANLAESGPQQYNSCKII